MVPAVLTCSRLAFDLASWIGGCTGVSGLSYGSVKQSKALLEAGLSSMN